MVDFLYSIDRQIFIFVNQTIANPVFDTIMPPLTDWNKSWIGISLFVFLWVLLMLKGGRRGRIVGLLLLPLILMSDQLSSTFFKSIFQRSRPCHEIDGLSMVEQVRMLVPCGSGYSFPSSHAVNNFAFATLLSFYYRRWSWLLFLYAFLMGLSRIVVGVHYPSDVIGGAIFGVICGYTYILVWEQFSKMFPMVSISTSTSIPTTSGDGKSFPS